MSFSAATIQQRWREVRKALDHDDFDALLVSDQLNFAYLTGHLSREFDKRFRSMLFVLDSDGGARAFLPAAEATVVRAISPSIDIETYSTVTPDLRSSAGFIEGILGRGRKRLGIEAGSSDRPGLSGRALEAIAGLVPAVCFADASPILTRARLLKSCDELARLEAAGKLAQEAWEATLVDLRPGMALTDISARLASAFISRGANYNFPGHIEVRNASCMTSETIGKGDTLWCDFGVTIDGYHSDVGRRAVLGKATPQQQENHRAGVELLRDLTGALRVGRPIGECMETMLRLRSKLHHGVSSPSRFGHGIGLCMSEIPSLQADEAAVLEAGMVLTPEPSFTAFDGEFVQLEEMVAISLEGPVQLTRGGDVFYEAG